MIFVVSVVRFVLFVLIVVPHVLIVQLAVHQRVSGLQAPEFLFVYTRQLMPAMRNGYQNAPKGFGRRRGDIKDKQLDPVTNPNLKTKMCEFHNTSKGCSLGDRCTHAHWRWELRPKSHFASGKEVKVDVKWRAYEGCRVQNIDGLSRLAPPGLPREYNMPVPMWATMYGCIPDPAWDNMHSTVPPQERSCSLEHRGLNPDALEFQPSSERKPDEPAMPSMQPRLAPGGDRTPSCFACCPFFPSESGVQISYRQDTLSQRYICAYRLVVHVSNELLISRTFPTEWLIC